MELFECVMKVYLPNSEISEIVLNKINKEITRMYIVGTSVGCIDIKYLYASKFPS